MSFLPRRPLNLLLPGLAVGPVLSFVLAAQEGGLQPGDVFSVKLQHGLVWAERGVHVAEGDLRPALENDPFFAEWTLRVEAKREGRLVVEPRAATIRYWVPWNPAARWSLEPKGEKSAPLAEDRLKDLALEWRHQLSDAVLRERIEAQLLGCALYLLAGQKIEAEIAPRDAAPRLVGFDELLAERLPAAFPRRLRPRLEALFVEALSLVVAPAIPRLERGAVFRSRGGEYRVEAAGKQGGRLTAQIARKEVEKGTGLTVKESLVVNVATGAVVRGERVVVPEALRDGATRFATARWKAELVGFHRARPRAAVR